MKTMKMLQGTGVALITPFKADKSVDVQALEQLVHYQIDNGVDYLVVLGTTAETPTLSAEGQRWATSYGTWGRREQSSGAYRTSTRSISRGLCGDTLGFSLL